MWYLPINVLSDVEDRLWWIDRSLCSILYAHFSFVGVPIMEIAFLNFQWIFFDHQYFFHSIGLYSLRWFAFLTFLWNLTFYRLRVCRLFWVAFVRVIWRIQTTTTFRLYDKYGFLICGLWWYVEESRIQIEREWWRGDCDETKYWYSDRSEMLETFVSVDIDNGQSVCDNYLNESNEKGAND